jgi:hypothetical protein
VAELLLLLERAGLRNNPELIQYLAAQAEQLAS